MTLKFRALCSGVGSEPSERGLDQNWRQDDQGNGNSVRYTRLGKAGTRFGQFSWTWRPDKNMKGGRWTGCGRLWPIHFWPILFCDVLLCVVLGVVCWCGCWFWTLRFPLAPDPPSDPPAPDPLALGTTPLLTAQNITLFVPSPAPIFALFVSLWVSSR